MSAVTESADAEVDATTGRVILIVDDDHKLADIVRRSLQRIGHTCVVSESGDHALWSMSAHEPDGIVLDVMIPHPSGVEVCRYLRSTGYQGAIVLMSARSNPDDRAAGQRAGADAFLAKPFTLVELTGALDSALGRAAQQTLGRAPPRSDATSLPDVRGYPRTGATGRPDGEQPIATRWTRALRRGAGRVSTRRG